MKPPRAPCQPLGEVSPNQRSRVVSAHKHGIKFPVIVRMETLLDSTAIDSQKRASLGFLHHPPPPQVRPTTTPHCNRPPHDTTCYCSQSKDNCPTAFCYMRATHLKEDCLSVSKEIGYIEVEVQGTAISNRGSRPTTSHMG
jgi:hypothetical protein